MSSEAMNREELTAFVRENFKPDDIWPEYLIFESEYDADDWIGDRVEDWETVAQSNGWVNPEWSGWIRMLTAGSDRGPDRQLPRRQPPRRSGSVL